MVAVAVIVVAVLSAGCTKPKTISDEELSEIFCDMFVAGGYCTIENFKTDSIDIYTPVLEQHGFAKRDLLYTLGSFSKRKSAKLSYVIDRAVEKLDAKSLIYQDKVTVLERIDSIATSRLSDTVLWRNHLSVNSFDDTARLRIGLKAAEGSYAVTMSYAVDTADHNRYIGGSVTLYRTNRTKAVNNRFQLTLGGERARYATRFKADTSARSIELLLADYARYTDTPCVAFDSIAIVHYPPVEFAIAKMDTLMMFRPNMFNDDTTKTFRPQSLVVPIFGERCDSLDSSRRYCYRDFDR